MSMLIQQLRGGLTAAVAKWGMLTTVGSFVLYVGGYLPVRFRLTALGLGTDLELLDERYVFEGIRFLVYIVSTAPIALLVALPAAGLGWIVLRVAPPVQVAVARWWSRQIGPLLIGILLAMALIQLAMRQCFRFDNLLLRETLPAPAWLSTLLTAPSDVATTLYFAGLLAGVTLTVLMLAALGPWAALTAGRRALAAVLIFLVVVEFLLLPVNYGVLMTARAVPRLTSGDDEAGTRPPTWLVWEGDKSMTCLVHEPAGPRLVTQARDIKQRLEIVGYDGLSALRHWSRPAVALRENEPSRVQNAAPSPTELAVARSVSAERPPDKPSAWYRAALVFGIAATPTLQRSAASITAAHGDLLLVALDGGEPEPLTATGDFSSPVFLPDDLAVLALRGEQLVRVRLAGGDPQPICALPATRRLIGFAPDAPGSLLYAGDDAGALEIRQVELESGRITAVGPLPDFVQRAYVLGEAREYGERRLAVEQRNSIAGEEWCDIVLQEGSRPPRDLTQGDGLSSRQPALSHNGRLVVFVRPRS